MRDAGSVDTRWEAPDGGRPRRYYAITDLGRAQLEMFASVWWEIGPEVDELMTERGKCST